MANFLYDDLADKVGGKFKLTVLIQKRLRELIRGAKPLIEVPSDANHLEIALEEIKTGLIWLKPGEDIMSASATRKEKEDDLVE